MRKIFLTKWPGSQQLLVCKLKESSGKSEAELPDSSTAEKHLRFLSRPDKWVSLSLIILLHFAEMTISWNSIQWLECFLDKSKSLLLAVSFSIS